MAYTKDVLRKIYDKTSGYCRYCSKKLAFTNYGQPGARAAWEVDHGRPRSQGGTNHRNNLHASCVSCNRKKGAKYPYAR